MKRVAAWIVALPSLAARAHAFVLLFAAALVTLAYFDRRLAPPGAAASGSPLSPATSAEAPGPVFVLLFDSLRYETAMDPQLMPELAAMRREGTFARLATVYQGFSIPAIRAAFGGIENSGLFTAIENFRHRAVDMPSVFAELRATGRVGAAVSPGQFSQFGATADLRFVHPFAGNDLEFGADLARLQLARQLLREGRHALVVAHLQFTDMVAHRTGVGHPEYNEMFQRADRMVADVRRSLPPGASFIVLGDHGHDLRGAHKTGLNIPTFIVACGPKFARGADLGALHIARVPLLLRWATGLPTLEEDWIRHRMQAARAGDVTPTDDATALVSAETRRMPTRLDAAHALSLALAWLVVAAKPERARALLAAATWLVLASLLLRVDGGLVTVFAAGLIALHTALTRTAAGAPPAAAALGCVALGWWSLGIPSDRVPHPGWISAGIVAAFVLARTLPPSCRSAVWVGLAGAAWFVVDSVTHLLGFTAQGSLAAALAGWLVLGLGGAAGVEGWNRRVALWTGLALFAWYFGSAYVHGERGEFVLNTPTGLTHMVPLFFVALAAKLFVFLPAYGQGRRRHIVATLITLAILVPAQWQAWSKTVSTQEPPALVIHSAFWILAALMTLRWGREFAPLARIGLLYALLYHFVRLDTYHYAWLDLWTAALVFLARRSKTTGTAREIEVPLALFAVAVAYYTTIGWVPGGVEWQAAYDWIPASVVELKVAWLLPWILAKTMLPLIILRTLLARELPAGARWPAAAIGAPIAGWIVAILAVSIGAFVRQPEPLSYQPAAEMVGALFLYLAASTWRQRTKPISIPAPCRTSPASSPSAHLVSRS